MQAGDREQMGKAGIPHGLKHILRHRRLASGDEGDGDAGDISIGNGGQDPAPISALSSAKPCQTALSSAPSPPATGVTPTRP